MFLDSLNKTITVEKVLNRINLHKSNFTSLFMAQNHESIEFSFYDVFADREL